MAASCSQASGVSTTIDDEVFLNLVLENPILYDKNHSNFRSNNQKNNCWEQLATKLQINGKRAKDHFRAIKEKYRREVKIEAGRSGDGARKTPRWGLFTLCQMLFDGESNKNTTTNLDSQEDSQEQDELFNIDELSVDMDNEMSNPYNSEYAPTTPSTSSVAPTRPNKKRKPETTPHDPLENVLQNISSGIQKFTSNKTQQYAGSKIQSFLTYLGSELKALPEDEADVFMDTIIMSLLDMKQKRRETNQ